LLTGPGVLLAGLACDTSNLVRVSRRTLILVVSVPASELEMTPKEFYEGDEDISGDEPTTR
jgi:hypothetical protein